MKGTPLAHLNPKAQQRLRAQIAEQDERTPIEKAVDHYFPPDVIANLDDQKRRGKARATAKGPGLPLVCRTCGESVAASWVESKPPKCGHSRVEMVLP